MPLEGSLRPSVHMHACTRWERRSLQHWSHLRDCVLLSVRVYLFFCVCKTCLKALALQEHPRLVKSQKVRGHLSTLMAMKISPLVETCSTYLVQSSQQNRCEMAPRLFFTMSTNHRSPLCLSVFLPLRRSNAIDPGLTVHLMARRQPGLSAWTAQPRACSSSPLTAYQRCACTSDSSK